MKSICPSIHCSKSVEYTQKTMDEALKKVKTINANLGGTEILRPLQHIFRQTCIPNQPRQVMELPIRKHSSSVFEWSHPTPNELKHILVH